MSAAKQPYESCIRFQRCSANRCPLDQARDLPGLERDAQVDDPEPKCTLPKRRRMALAATFGLSNRGLWPRELSSLEQWEALPAEERERRSAVMAERGRAALAALHAAKGQD